MTTCYHPEHRLLYVHIPKTAGTTLGGNYKEDENVWHDSWLNDVLPGWSRKGIPNGHQPVRTMEFWTGMPEDHWKKIIVTIRNPFEHQVSQYRFWRARGMRNAENRRGCHEDDLFALSVDFERFVADPRSNGPSGVCGYHWAENGGVFRWWCLGIDRVIPDNLVVVKMENLQSGMEAALAGCGAQFKEIPIRNSWGYRENWRDWYTYKAAETVRQKFSWSLSTYYPELTTFPEEVRKKSLVGAD